MSTENKWYSLHIKGTKTYCYFLSDVERMKFIAKNSLKYEEIELSCFKVKSMDKQINNTTKPLGTIKR